MTLAYCVSLEQFMYGVKKRHSGQVEFHQAIQEVANVLKKRKYI